MKEFDKVLGGLFGIACGDALGGTLEFLTIEEGTKRYGYLQDILGGGTWDLKIGETTDDTAMTIAVAKGILDEPDMPWKSIGKYFLEWADSKPADIGITIGHVMDEYRDCKDWSEAAYKVNDKLFGKSAGNGSLMRCIPVGLYYEDINRVKEISRVQSSLTHYDKKAGTACELYNTLIYEYLRGNDKANVMEKTLKEYPEYQEVYKMKKSDLKPTGYVVDALFCALWCFINTSSFEEAVCEAVNLCGDADTIGAITGGLAGAFYGYDAIPERWRSKIIIAGELKDLAENLYKNIKDKPGRFNVDEVTVIEAYVGEIEHESVGIKVSFEKGKAFYNIFGDEYKRGSEETTDLSKEVMDKFKSDLKEIGIQVWHRKYKPFDSGVDGTQWSIKVRTGRKSYESSGDNWYPENWPRFCKIVEKLVGHKFK